MSQKLENYLANVQKCRRLIAFLGLLELNNLSLFDLFCYWYDYIYEAPRTQDDEKGQIEYTLDEKIRIGEVDLPTFLGSVKLYNISKFEPHSLRNPERIKINDIIQNCTRGNCVLPNFQRYFDWTKNNIKEFLESIFNDYYVGALLFWDIAQDPQLENLEN